MDSWYARVLLIGGVLFVLYTLLFPPRKPHNNNHNTTTANSNNNNNHTAHHVTSSSSHKRTDHHHHHHHPKLQPVVPLHVHPSALTATATSTVLHAENWIVTFASGHAAAAQDATDRQDRARLLSRLHDTDALPAAKGSTVVLAVPSDDLDCRHLHRAVYLLATYYNVMLLVSVTANATTSRTTLLDRLRVGVPETALPDHRLIRTGSVTGRVAFCRQMRRTDWILDFDAAVQEQLGRFGQAVVLYGQQQGVDDNNNNNDQRISRLGRVLIS